MTCRHGSTAMYCGWCEDVARLKEQDVLLRQALAALEYEREYHATWKTRPFAPTTEAIAAIRKHLGQP